MYTHLQRATVFVLYQLSLLTGIVLLGLLHREKHGMANIGFESVLILVLYLGVFSILIWSG
jgi:cation:H+ antiporter